MVGGARRNQRGSGAEKVLPADSFPLIRLPVERTSTRSNSPELLFAAGGGASAAVGSDHA